MADEQPAEDDVTALLRECAAGRRDALDRLLPIVYDEMRRLAASYLRRERSDHTLQPTALAHEAYLKLVGQRVDAWQSRAHFFGVAAQAMRRILVDHARARRADKRGGEAQRLSLTAIEGWAGPIDVDIVALDDALRGLAAVDARKAQVVDLRFFGGLSVEETAEALGIAPVTVMRDWTLARAYLLKETTHAAR